MALQSKTLLNDVGSAVLAETVSQLNRASGYVHGPNSAALISGTRSTVLCVFEEDVLVTQVTFSFTGAANMTTGTDVVSLVTGTATDGSVGAVAVSAVGYLTPLADDTFHTMSEAQAGADNLIGAPNVGQMPFAVDAGDALTLRVFLGAGSGAITAVVQNITVAYRPVKDALNMEPAFTPAMTNFRSVTR
jgi:hypothetical protein